MKPIKNQALLVISFVHVGGHVSFSRIAYTVQRIIDSSLEVMVSTMTCYDKEHCIFIVPEDSSL